MKKSRLRRKQLRAKAFTRPAKPHRAKLKPSAQAASTISARVYVNRLSLAPFRSFGAPPFLEKGYYEDLPFTCTDCGIKEVWTAAAQKWWYEVAKGYAYSTAVRCRACRRLHREKREQSRRVHAEGLARKKNMKRSDA